MPWYEKHGKVVAALGLSFEHATDAALNMVEARAASRPFFGRLAPMVRSNGEDVGDQEKEGVLQGVHQDGGCQFKEVKDLTTNWPDNVIDHADQSGWLASFVIFLVSADDACHRCSCGVCVVLGLVWLAATNFCFAL